MPTINISTHFNFKISTSPLQNQCNTRVCHRISSLVFFSQIALFRVLLFNPTIENEKATNK